MDFLPLIKKYPYTVSTIDSHTMGESTRIIVKGFPELKGNSMMEKKQDLQLNHDTYRRALVLEPRGHKDMFGAVLTEPTVPEADFGVIFMDDKGCLNMCGHGSIGVATALVEAELVEIKEPYTYITLEVPCGIIKTKVHVEYGRAREVSILNVPSFLYKKDVTLNVNGYGSMTFDISFGGNFFAIVDGEKLAIKPTSENLKILTDMGMKLLESIRKNLTIAHPSLDITSVDLVEFSFPPENPKADRKNVVIFGDDQIDRSPCGSGTSAKVADLYADGKLKLHDSFVHESVIGSLFTCEPVKEVKVGTYPAVIPQITGQAWITGFNNWVIDDRDPFGDGFLIENVQCQKEA